MHLAHEAEPPSLDPALLSLLRTREPWCSALERRARALEPARAAADLVAFIHAQLDGQLQQDTLARACSIACVLRSPALLPALVRVATSERPRMRTVCEALDAIAGVSLEHDVRPALVVLARLACRSFLRDVRSGDPTREFAAYARFASVCDLVRDVGAPGGIEACLEDTGS